MLKMVTATYNDLLNSAENAFHKEMDKTASLSAYSEALSELKIAIAENDISIAEIKSRLNVIKQSYKRYKYAE